MSNSKSSSSSKSFPNYTTSVTPVVSSFQRDTRTSPQIVFEDIITPYEEDPSLVFSDMEDMLRHKKVKMSNAEKVTFIAAVVRNYKLSDTCKAAINVLCEANLGGSI